MGVRVDARLYYGWRVNKSDIPDFDKHKDRDWGDVFCAEGEWKAMLGGEETDFYPEELVLQEDTYSEADDSWHYVGYPLKVNCSISEFNERIAEADMHAGEIFRKVFGRECNRYVEPPKLWLFEEWC